MVDGGSVESQMRLSDIGSDLAEVSVEGVLVAVVDNLNQLFQFGTYAFDVRLGPWVEEYLAQQRVVLSQDAAGYLQVALERRAGCILVLHHG